MDDIDPKKGLSEDTVAAMATMAGYAALLSELTAENNLNRARMAVRLESLQKFMAEKYPDQSDFIGQVFGMFLNSMRSSDG